MVLMPDRDGHVGEAVVTNQGGSQILDKPYQATSISGIGSAPTQPALMEQSEIERDFARALAAEPDPPVVFIFYFNVDFSELTPEYLSLLPNVLAAIKKRDSVDISIVGHCDTAGANSYNFLLSKRRAENLAHILTERGVDESTLSISWHGENDPLIKTGDNIFEPRNRRVEITVR